MESKKPWQSKTVVVNGIMGLLSFVAIFLPGAEGLKSLINGHPGEIIMAWSVIGIALRMISKDKIALVD
jgi:hypothetical protein